MKFNQWSKNGIIQRIFEELQSQNIIEVQGETLCLGSTSVKVHPNAAGAKKLSGEQSAAKKSVKTFVFMLVAQKNRTLIPMKKQPRAFFYITFTFVREMACAATHRDLRVEDLDQNGANSENSRGL